MKTDNQELVWVDKEFAERLKVFETAANKRELEIEAFDEYIEGVKNTSVRDFKANFESLEEDVAVYKGLMLSVKQAFEKTKNEQLNASYELWEKFEADLPSVTKKTENIIKQLSPFVESLTKIKDLIAQIDVWGIDQLSESINMISSLHGENKEMFEFLVQNFSKA